MNKETQIGPTAAGVGIAADGKTVVVANWETDSVTSVDVVNGVVAMNTICDRV
jgi:DNA-binding beta-propeller fold protein YncE